jgi:hypothetical protein
MFLYGKEVELMMHHFGAEVETETTEVVDEGGESTEE